MPIRSTCASDPGSESSKTKGSSTLPVVEPELVLVASVLVPGPVLSVAALVPELVPEVVAVAEVVVPVALVSLVSSPEHADEASASARESAERRRVRSFVCMVGLVPF